VVRTPIRYKGDGLLRRYVSVLESTSKRIQLFKVAGRFYGFIPVNISVWLYPSFSERVAGTLTVSGPPTHFHGSGSPYPLAHNP
jgi:hypothetical protein